MLSYAANGSAPSNQLLSELRNVGVGLVEAGDNNSSSKQSALH